MPLTLFVDLFGENLAVTKRIFEIVFYRYLMPIKTIFVDVYCLNFFTVKVALAYPLIAASRLVGRVRIT